MVHLCMVNVITDCDEKTVLKISGVSESDAMATAMKLINGGGLGLKETSASLLMSLRSRNE